MKPIAPAPLPPVNQPAAFVIADAVALKALERGEATEAQQKRALDWILRSAADLGGIGFRGEAPMASAFHEGRRFVGSQVVGLLKIDISKLKDDKNGN